MATLKHCLIIDDDPDDREIFMMCVNKISDTIDCVTAKNGVDALELLENKTDLTPDFIFLDVNMPKMNGIECLKHLRKIDRLRNSKIFMYSTTSEGGIIKQSKELGAQDFIVKPVKISELREILSKIFGVVSEIK